MTGAIGPRAPTIARWAGLALVLVPLLVRAMMGFELLPGWELDPLVIPPSGGTLGPQESVRIDAMVIVGALLLMASAPGKVRWGLIVLAMIGCVPILYHAYFASPFGGLAWTEGTGGTGGNRRIGLAWLAGIGAAVALAHAGRDASVRRITGGVIIGFVAMLAVRGAQQIFVEHPRTLADWTSQKDVFLAAQGWTPGSSMARSFERRLVQPEASAWFGLSNVYGTFAAAGFVASAGWAALVWRLPRVKGRARLRTLSLLSLLLAGTSMALSQSKGAMVAGAAGLVLLGAMSLVRSRITHRNRGLFGAGLALAGVLTALALIPLRGLVGERIGELSILFRWFYAQAALRMFAAHPARGVGPDGFQQAYLLAKNPLSPEEVVSPHSIFLDYIATLGIPGLAWALLLLLLAAGAARSATSSIVRIEADHAGTQTRTEVRAALGIVSISVLIAAWMQATIATPDLSAVWCIGLLAWCAVAGVSVVIGRTLGSWHLPIACAAVTALVHGQIDVALSWTQSCGLTLALLGVAASVPHAGEDYAEPVLWRVRAAGAVATIACAGVLVVMLTSRSPLREGANAIGITAEFGTRFRSLSEGDRPTLSPDRDTRERFIADLASTLAHPIASNREAVERGLAELELAAIARALPFLQQASEQEPGDWRPLRESARLHLRAAAVLSALGREPEARAERDQALEVLRSPSVTQTSSGLRFLAQVWEQVGRGAPEERPQALSHAIQALEDATQLDPFNADIPLRLMRLNAGLGRADQARRWARTTLEFDALTRLDRAARGLAENDLSEARRTAGGS